MITKIKCILCITQKETIIAQIYFKVPYGGEKKETHPHLKIYQIISFKTIFWVEKIKRLDRGQNSASIHTITGV